ncbi:MAG: lysine--tRNA ligase [Paracoccaceae bacterium]|nr:lysine--tRNA ligase [Paracoccaceae bacterium]
MGYTPEELDQLKAWPFVEAKKLLKRINNKTPAKGYVLFQTGYGPSGLPHIGTFGEVARTTMVRRAFQEISDIPTKLVCFSDDLDGFRKVPLNVPNRDRLQEDLGLPLTKVTDPFGECKSFAHYNNQKLRSFLDSFDFEYEFISATQYYQDGKFDEMLMLALERYDQLMDIMLPSLGGVTKGRDQSYSPFLPVSPVSGKVLQVPVLDRNISKGTILYQEPDGEMIELPVTGGNVKMQWKPDWAMRWAQLEVDYEMYGKDLIPSAELARKLCRVFGKPPPLEMFYELFLDENGRKISKSSGGEGISMENWIDYSSPDSLGLFMFQKPKTAKRLTFDAVPRAVDDLQKFVASYPSQGLIEQLNNPAWHVYAGNPPKVESDISYAMILNLVGAAGTADEEVIWGLIQKHANIANPSDNPELYRNLKGAINYFNERVAPTRSLRTPNEKERIALEELRNKLLDWTGGNSGEEYQSMVYSIGKNHQFDPLRSWFAALYETLFGTSQGPRFGSFIALFGARKTADLISQRLKDTSFASRNS